MGSCDGAYCELIGIYLLHELSKIVDENDISLYRAEGLIILSNYQTKQTKPKE